jgi:hypothetical protein
MVLGLAASGAVLPCSSLAASLEKGTLELETSVDLSHTAYSEDAVGSRTNFEGTVGAGYSLTRMFQVGGGLLIGYHSGETDPGGSFSYSALGAAADVTVNFETPNILIPFVRAGVGFRNYSGDGYEDAKVGMVLPYVRGGVRVLVGNSASVNLSVAYRRIVNADGADGLDANNLSFAVGLSIFPIRGE